MECATDMCYSLISRSRDRRNKKEAEKYRRESFPTYYASKSVIEWSRMNVWACHDLVNHTVTVLVIRCPDHLMTSFVSTFSGQRGTTLLQHPILTHAYLCSDYLSHSYDFLGAFSEDIYDLVGAATTKLSHSRAYCVRYRRMGVRRLSTPRSGANTS